MISSEISDSSKIFSATFWAKSAFLNSCKHFNRNISTKFSTAESSLEKSSSVMVTKFWNSELIVFKIRDFGSKSSNSPLEIKWILSFPRIY